MKKIQDALKTVLTSVGDQKQNKEAVKTVEPCWLAVADSVIGKSHISNHTVCQDNHYFGSFKQCPDWGIAVVCDGAGSAVNSHLGSEFVAKKVIPSLFEKAIIDAKWHLHSTAPSDEEWKELAWEQLKNTYLALKNHAENELGKELSSLSCTVIIVVYSPHGLFVTHIGDGRAAYCNEQGEWHPLIVPHKGEEANMTFFLTSITWLQHKHFELPNGNTIPESRIVRGKHRAFTLLSDGMEQHSFVCSSWDSVNEQWSDPNQAFSGFFDPLVKAIKSEITNEGLNASIHDGWKKILTSGTPQIANENDDKTMILAIHR